MQFQQFKIRVSNLPTLLVLLCCLASIGLSAMESRLNTDAHHWGLMYANAADLHSGLIPYRQIFIQYGVLTTLLQSFSLSLFGNCMASIGIMTGVFYAANIFLSYLLWQKIMIRWLAALSALVMFLVHGYIIYPWSNYFSYTFFLIALLFLLRKPDRLRWYFLSGLSLTLSFLARQSLLPLLLPLYAYFVILVVSAPADTRKFLLKQIALFHAGLLGLLALFFLYLLQAGAVHDWVAQSITLLSLFTEHLGKGVLIFTQLFKGIFFAQSATGCDARTLLYSILFFNALGIIGILLLKFLRGQMAERDRIMFLLSVVTIFGYVQSLHIYEIFRLQSAASLGFGLLIVSIDRFTARWENSRSILFSILITFLLTTLGLSMLFTKTSSVYSPWLRHYFVSKELGAPEHVEEFRHALYDKQTRSFYDGIVAALHPYVGKLPYFVNLTKVSTVPPMVVGFKKVQRAPFYAKELSELIFPDEQKLIPELIVRGEALVITETLEEVPKSYAVVSTLPIPHSIPWMEHPSLYVAVPTAMVGGH
jgi:hypothetical protein